MTRIICSNCGKEQRWYEPKKIDPETKKLVCRKCGNVLNSEEEKKEAPVGSSEPNIGKLVLDITASFNSLRKKQRNIIFPSVPVLYLGDLPKFKKSYPKVITAGYNPSNNEFPTNSIYKRFKEIENFKTSNKDAITIYLNSLNNYFNDQPDKWYNSFNLILEGLNTSYYSNLPNRSLHTYLCSPIATDTSWGKLKSSTKFTLSSNGRRFWYRLVEILEPDMILFSVDKEYINRVVIKKLGWKIFKSIKLKADGSPRDKPYDIEITEGRISSKKMHLVYGPPSYLPFGSISNESKVQLGKELMNFLEKQ